MLRLNYNDIGIVFSVHIDGHDIHFREWGATDDCIYYQPLSVLVDNGQAKFYKSECIVPYENLYLLDSEERVILGIPEPYDKAMRLHGEGMLNNQDFKYKIEFLTHIPDGDLLACERSGNIIFTKDKKYLLSEAQYELVNRVEAFNTVVEEQKTTDFNLRRFSDIKVLAILAGCEMDSYLQNENVYAPERIKIEIGRDEEGFTVDPSIDIEENDKFRQTFNRMRKVQSVYPVQRENGERVRVVLNPEQKENLSHIKSGGRHKTREELQTIVEHPTEYFDPDIFDLSALYSDRVIEIGVYKPKFYPFVCPYQSCWIAGATIETPQNGTTKLTISSEDELNELNQAIHMAEKRESGVVEYNDTQIDIDDARFLAETAEKQLRTPKQPIVVEERQ